jgi:hypothetical protein
VIYSQQDIYNKLVGGGIDPQNAQILAATAHGESGLNTEAIGDGGNSIGLFQIYMPAHPDKLQAMTGSTDRAVWEEWLKDPINNINAAIAVYNSQGLGAWTIYNIGAYKAYLNDVDTNGAAPPADPVSTDTQNAHIGTWNQSLFERAKSKLEDAWYYIKGTQREYDITPSAADQLAAREQFNSKYGLDLPTTALQEAVQYENSLKLSNKLFTAGILALILLIVFIVGAYAFFKAFDISAPSPAALAAK